MRGKRSGWGVRRHAVVSALVVTTLALLTGGALLMWILQSRLESGLRSDTTALARDLAFNYGEQKTTDPPKARQPPSQSLIIQIIDARGVVSSTSPKYATTPLDEWHEFDDATAHSSPSKATGAADLLVASHRFTRGSKEYAVVVASSTAGAEETVSTVALVLVGTFPLLLAGVAIGTWVLVGGSLRSVSDITTTVRQIRRGQLDERVAVPKSNDEIALLATMMNDMLERLEKADESQRRFVSDASHDLRTPIASILAAVEVARAEGTLQSWHDMEPVIENEAHRMQHLVEGLLTLARSDDGRLDLRPQPVDLDDLVIAAAAAVRARSPFQVTTHLEPVQIVCDPRLTAQVLGNIVQNAERYATSHIVLSCRPDGEHGCIEVRNDGPPIPVEDRERVFDRFVRLDSSRTHGDHGSSGLGLAIARELIHAQGGEIYTDADEHGMCRFVIRLPAQPGLSDEPQDGDD